MYLERRSVHDLPPDAVVVSEDEAIEYYQKHIFSSKFTNEIWPLKYGFGIPGFVSVATSFSLITYYRSRLRLGNIGRILLPLTCSALPVAFSLGAHHTQIQSAIILQKSCSSCTKIRSVLFQNLFAVVYPVVPGAFLTLLLAIQHETYPVPGFQTKTDILDTAKLYVKFTQRIYPRILLFVLLNSISVWYITSLEFNSFEKLNKRLKEQDQKLRSLVNEYKTSN